MDHLNDILNACDGNMFLDDSTYQAELENIARALLGTEDFMDLPIRSSVITSAVKQQPPSHPPKDQLSTPIPSPDTPQQTSAPSPPPIPSNIPEPTCVATQCSQPQPITISIKGGKKMSKLALDELEMKVRSLNKILQGHKRHLKSLENSIYNTMSSLMDIQKDILNVLHSLQETQCE